MQVDALGQHIGSDDDVIVVAPFFLILCVKVGFDGVAQTVATLGANGKNVAAMQALFQLLFQIIDGIHTFAEHHELAAWVLLLVEQFALQHGDEEFQFGVGFHFLPSLAQFVQYLGIVFQHGKEIGQEVSSVEENFFLVESLADGQFNDFVQLYAVSLQLFHIQIRGDDDLVFLEHLNHSLGGIKEGMKRFLESIEAAFQAFHHVGLIDGSQRIGHVLCHFPRRNFVGRAILNGTITGITQTASVEHVRVYLFQVSRWRVH